MKGVGEVYLRVEWGKIKSSVLDMLCLICFVRHQETPKAGGSVWLKLKECFRLGT